MTTLGNYYLEHDADYDLAKKYYLMAIALKDTDAMHSLASYYDDIEKNYELMLQYYLLAINSEGGHEASFQALTKKCRGNHLALYKLLITVPEESRLDYLTAKLVVLEMDKMVKAFNNKVRIFKRLQNFNQCAVCLEENVLLVDLDCGHEICIHCYDPQKKCHYHC